ncbi:MAG: toxin-antitoxin system HicB family antitoxin [Caldilineaceae bacterium]|nr:toxin-antitoxin system HicB family antitoxin [Caldilineaceae bacterium]MCB0093695.1 toxin-antitoxin system HicB family antitoxin [Caldilineaceae bacterium]MCB0094541.1 toxin-antitoxin system HicB family antitoxin [Caldilineaceae bacterium]MCB0144093.1 toxin-antitoxin system HicB family antitoxin [Caldilineaceae bacterium]
MGRFTVRLPDSLHHDLEERARIEGVSLNQYVVYALTQKVVPSYTIQVVSDDEIEQQRTRFEALLKRLGPPDRDVANKFLSQRETQLPDDAEEADLVARVKARINAETQPIR